MDLMKILEDQYKIMVRWELGKDDTIESLRDYTLAHPVDLVVMGIESNLTDYKLFGNTTTSAIKLMQFSLLVVPNNVHYQRIEEIMFAGDSTYLNPLCGLDRSKAIVRLLKADLEVFHVLANDSSEEKNKFEREMESLLKDIAHTFRYTVHARVGDGIEKGLKESPVDLLIMIPHVLRFFESIFRESNTSYVAVRTKVPLFVIPNKTNC